MNKVVYVNQDGSVEVVNGPGGEVDRLARTISRSTVSTARRTTERRGPSFSTRTPPSSSRTPASSTSAVTEAVRAKYSRKFPDAAQASDGRELVDAVIRGELALNPNESYGTVYRRVLANDAELRAVYR